MPADRAWVQTGRPSRIRPAPIAHRSKPQPKDGLGARGTQEPPDRSGGACSGPPEEVAVVQEIYQRFLEQQEREREIAHALNSNGVLTDGGRPWTHATVHQVLTNPKYIGANVYNRRSFKLKRKRVANPPDMWICKDQAFQSVILPEIFHRVQEQIATAIEPTPMRTCSDFCVGSWKRRGHSPAF